MNLTEPHRRLLAEVLAVATENPEPMEKIAATVGAGLEQRGWQVRGLETGPPDD